MLYNNLLLTVSIVVVLVTALTVYTNAQTEKKIE